MQQHSHLPPGDTGSDKTITLISQWLDDCVREHPTCGTSDETLWMPTRVVEIYGEEKVRLCTTAKKHLAERYVCLSHCWGKGELFRTLKANFDKHHNDIPWDKIPKTFRDAISVTRRLGLKYLWIDSLCITQDDGDDWRREGSKMDFIYSKSFLTIAATKAAGPTEGCFTSDDSLSRTLTLENTHGESYTIVIEKSLLHNIDEWPIMTRACKSSSPSPFPHLSIFLYS